MYKTDNDVTHYFVSGGFAVVREDATASVTVSEAVEVSELDPAAVAAGVTKYTNEVASGKTTSHHSIYMYPYAHIFIYGSFTHGFGLTLTLRLFVESQPKTRKRRLTQKSGWKSIRL